MARDRLTPKQLRGITAILSTATVQDAARVVGVTPRTLGYWLSQPHFQAALAAAEREQLQAIHRELRGHQARAITVLRELMDSPKSRPTVRLRAAALLLDIGLRLRQTIELEQRIAQLEQQLEQQEETVWPRGLIELNS